MTSPLDKACDEMGVALNAVEVAESNFYDTFLNTELFFVINKEPPKSGIAEAGEEFDVVMVEGDGQSYLMLFDSEERLQNWAKRDVVFMESYGSEIIMNFEFNNNTFIMLNHETEYWKEFTPEEISWLRSNIEEDK